MILNQEFDSKGTLRVPIKLKRMPYSTGQIIATEVID